MAYDDFLRLLLRYFLLVQIFLEIFVRQEQSTCDYADAN